MGIEKGMDIGMVRVSNGSVGVMNDGVVDMPCMGKSICESKADADGTGSQPPASFNMGVVMGIGDGVVREEREKSCSGRLNSEGTAGSSIPRAGEENIDGAAADDEADDEETVNAEEEEEEKAEVEDDEKAAAESGAEVARGCDGNATLNDSSDATRRLAAAAAAAAAAVLSESVTASDLRLPKADGASLAAGSACSSIRPAGGGCAMPVPTERWVADAGASDNVLTESDITNASVTCVAPPLLRFTMASTAEGAADAVSE